MFVRFSPAKNVHHSFEHCFVIADYLNALMVGVSIVFFQFYRKYQYSIYDTLELNQSPQNEFTLVVDNLPPNFPDRTMETALRQYFETKVRVFIREVENREGEQTPEHISF